MISQKFLKSQEYQENNMESSLDSTYGKHGNNVYLQPEKYILLK
jgi:hypothetical protein